MKGIFPVYQCDDTHSYSVLGGPEKKKEVLIVQVFVLGSYTQLVQAQLKYLAKNLVLHLSLIINFMLFVLVTWKSYKVSIIF